MAKNVGRYSLVAYNPNNKQEVLMGVGIDDLNIYTIGNKDKKSILSAIDMYTMQFGNVDELGLSLLYSKIIDGDVNLSIKYECNGTKKTPILYEKDSDMALFASELSSYVDTNTSAFQNLLTKVLKSTENKKYMDYMSQNGYINEHLYQKLLEYKNSITYADLEFLTNKIITDLSSYKAIRDIYVGTKKYKCASAMPLDETTSFDEYQEDVEDYRFDDVETEMLDVFLHGGEEELDSLYDEIPERVKQKIIEYHKKGL